jgi:hypothetical protein
MSDTYVYWLLFRSALLLSLFFLPSLIAIFTHDPRYLTVMFWNVLIGWTGLGWLYLLYKVWPTPLQFVARFLRRRSRRSQSKSPLTQ